MVTCSIFGSCSSRTTPMRTHAVRLQLTCRFETLYIHNVSQFHSCLFCCTSAFRNRPFSKESTDFQYAQMHSTSRSFQGEKKPPYIVVVFYYMIVFATVL